MQGVLRMTTRLFARLAIANPDTHKISLTKEFVEVSGTDIRTMDLPAHVVRVDFFADISSSKPDKRVFIGEHEVYSTEAIEEHFGPMFVEHLSEAGATHAVFMSSMNKLIPVMPGDEIASQGKQTSIQ
jgi:hypothetical protein